MKTLFAVSFFFLLNAQIALAEDEKTGSTDGAVAEASDTKEETKSEIETDVSNDGPDSAKSKPAINAVENSG